MKTNEKGFLYKCKLILNDVFYRMVSNTERVSATPFEEMSPPELNKCLQKFYLSARKRNGSFYNKKSLTAIQTALDRHLLFQSFPRGKILESLLECMNQNQFLVLYIISLF